MSDERGRPDSSKSRQELLDEIYYLRDIAGEREEQIRRLRGADTEAGASAMAELDRVLHSRSWRWTAPLRWLARVLRRSRSGAPVLAGSVVPRQTYSAADSAFQDHADAVGRLLPSAAPLEVREHGERRLYVDVSELVLHRGRTGVQRVAREILRGLLASPPSGFAVQPVCALPGYAYRAIDHFNPDASGAGEAYGAIIAPRAGDLFLGLDHSMQAVIAHAPDLGKMRREGIRIWFVCNDILPLERPEWFPADVAPRFEAWLRVVLDVSDGVACISRATESALRARLSTMGVPRAQPVKIAHFGLGANLPSGTDTSHVTPEEAAQLDRLKGVDSFLIVGTLEPRKGHAQTLEAFNLLWTSGEDVALVLAGLPGWMTGSVQRRIRHHDEFGRRLFWFNDASDAVLERLYSSCTALLAPSEGEGFGLPLVEASRRGLPILCRDLPVFREFAAEDASYFSGLDPAALATAIREWLIKYRGGNATTVRNVSWLTWSQSARQLTELIFADDGQCDDGQELAGRGGKSQN
jgi:glycosyltransferase involved in cell wall biosynthesis